MEKEKSLGYSLFVDEDMNDLLVLLCNLYSMAEESGLFEKYPPDDSLKIQLAFMRLLKNAVEPAHKLGWCKDPDCEWVDKDKKDDKNNTNKDGKSKNDKKDGNK
jgi:hypothetical protein